MRRTDLIFFLSGAAALVYEIVWARLLSRVLGSQSEATALVLAVFMGGLGLGALLFARPAHSTRRPQIGYAALEGFVALWAALSPFLLGAIEPLEGLAARTGVAALVLLPPTLAMGATFPWMGRLAVRDRASLGSDTSSFYGANTLGACAGVLLAVAVLMPALGLNGALFAAAVLSAAAGALALGLRPATASEPVPATRSPSLTLAPLVAPFLFGFSALALEVVLARVLVTVTGASVYAFALVLAVFLGGIGLGSREARAWLRDPSRAPRVLALCGLAVPIVSLAGILALRWHIDVPDLFGSLGNRKIASGGTWALWLSHAIVAALALLGPAIAFGAALPACASVAARRSPDAPAERVLGNVYFANTLGALLGSLAAGFWMMPALGARAAYAIALVPAFLAGFAGGERRGALQPVAALVAVALGFAALTRSHEMTASEVLFLATGRAETVAVEELVEPGGAKVRSIRINGKVEASTAPVDMRLQRLLAHVPALLHGRVERALVIGMGTGMTAGALLDHPTLRRLDLYELEPAVAPAARHFSQWNGALLDDERVRVRFVDGRHALFTGDERYDLITADPVHIWTRGSSDLYTLEYFQRMAAQLAPGGVASQWISLYELSTDDVKTMVATWCAAFAHTQAYLTAYDLALIGGNGPIATDVSASALPLEVERHLREVGVDGPLDVAASKVAGDAELRQWCSGAEPMRDARPVLEFRAPLSFLSGYSVDALRWAGRDEYVEQLPEAARPRARELRDALRGFLDRLPNGLSAAAEWYGDTLIGPR